MFICFPVTIMDKLLFKKMNNMIKLIDSYSCVRINSSGGYSPMDSFYEIDEHLEADNIMVSKYLKGDLDFLVRDVLNINSKVLVIENDKTISGEQLAYLKSKGMNNKDTYILDDFRHKTNAYTKENYIDMFKNAFSNGLTDIVVETTMQDKNQFNLLKGIIESVVTDMKIYLNIHILKVGDFEDVTTDCEYISIINL